VDSEENSCLDDSDFSDKVGIERRLIRPQIKPQPPSSNQLIRDRKDESILTLLRFQHTALTEKEANLSSTINKKKDSSDESSGDEQKKKHER